jgi:hypothetical protein
VILANNGQSESGRARRRAYPIHMYVGRNGAGKTLAAVYDTLPTLERGRPVLSTVRLLDYTDPRPCADHECEDVMHGAPDHMAAHPLYTPFTRWEQLLEWSFGDVLMDEVTGVADSNESSSMPSLVANKLPQLRRHDVALRITAHNFIRANKRIRESVNAVTRCRSSMPVSKKSATGEDRVWRARRLSKLITYDAQTLPLDDITAHAYDQADKLVTSRIWIPKCEAIRAYDTFAPVLIVGTVTDSGRCAYCAGTRRAPECSCPDYLADREARRGAGADRAQRGSTRARHAHDHPAHAHSNGHAR